MIFVKINVTWCIIMILTAICTSTLQQIYATANILTNNNKTQAKFTLQTKLSHTQD